MGKTSFQNDAHTLGPWPLVSAEDVTVAIGTLLDMPKDRDLVPLVLYLASARRIATDAIK